MADPKQKTDEGVHFPQQTDRGSHTRLRVPDVVRSVVDAERDPASVLRLSETFLSVQGEGKLVGVPSFFVRSSGCNLRCTWCDTPETSWDPEGEVTAVSDVYDEVITSKARHVVLTGGEPLLSAGILALGKKLRRNGHHVTIETAASFDPFAFGEPEADLFSISPKLKSSVPRHTRFEKEHDERRWRPDFIEALMSLGDYQLKFVIGTEDDLEEADAMVRELGAPVAQVVLMPEGTTVERLNAIGPWLAMEAVKRGYRFSDRLHVRLFGHTRGT